MRLPLLHPTTQRLCLRLRFPSHLLRAPDTQEKPRNLQLPECSHPGRPRPVLEAATSETLRTGWNEFTRRYHDGNLK